MEARIEHSQKGWNDHCRMGGGTPEYQVWTGRMRQCGIDHRLYCNDVEARVTSNSDKVPIQDCSSKIGLYCDLLFNKSLKGP